MIITFCGVWLLISAYSLFVGSRTYAQLGERCQATGLTLAGMAVTLLGGWAVSVGLRSINF